MPLPGFWRFAQHLPCFQALHPLSVCNWRPSSCCPGGEFPTGRLHVLSPCRPFKPSLLKIQQFLLPPQPPLVFTARCYGDLSSWCWNPRLRYGLAQGLLARKVSLPIFIHHRWWDCPFAAPASLPRCIFLPPPLQRHSTPVRLDEGVVLKSLVVRLPYSSIF